jgi:uncharacterized protein (DUF2345 family)
MKRLVLLASLLVSFMLPAAAFAYDPLAPACGSSAAAQSSSACSANGSDPITGTNGVLKKVSLILASVSGIVAIIIIIVAGLEMVISNGDSQKVARSRTAIIGAAVGLGIIVASESILLFVIRRL